MATNWMGNFDAYEKGDYVEVCPVDHQMDESGASSESINVWPKKCEHCWLDDIDTPPSPYLLGRRIDRPAEFDLACYGNFFAKDRVRRIIELLFPGQCVFHPTFEKKNKQQTPWFLGVPVATVDNWTPGQKDESPRCAVCDAWKYVGTGKYHYPISMGADFAKWLKNQPGEVWEDNEDRIADANNRPRKPRTSRWTRMGYWRGFFVSLRVELLFKKLGIKSLHRCGGWTTRATQTDKDWVSQQIQRLAELGLAERTLESPSDTNLKWFTGYLKKNGRKKATEVDFSAIETELGKPLPDSYMEFFTRVGKKSYANLDDTEGFDAEIIGPGEIDLTSYRKGKLDIDDEESAEVDGVMFATTGHGDVFCFDIAASGPDYPVYLFEHELTCFSAFAPNFVACLKRFVDGD